MALYIELIKHNQIMGTINYVDGLNTMGQS